MRLALAAAAAAGVAGCDTIFGLQSLAVVDAHQPADTADVHDEDLDGLPDAVDPCPVDAGPATSDSDGDGFPDLCDPWPGMPGDHVALFDAYATGHLAWQATGSVTQGNDEIELAVGASVRYAMTFHLPTAQIHVNGQELVSGSAIGVYLGTSSNGAPLDGLECDTIWDPIGQTELRGITWFGGTAMTTAVQPAPTTTLFAITANVGNGTCTGWFGTSMVTVTVPVPTANAPASTSILTGPNNGAAIQSTIVYDR